MKRLAILVISIIVTLLGLFVAYQIIRKILGSSWSIEDIIISLLIFNLGVMFTIGLSLSSLKSDHKHLSNQFKSLASDFKEHIRKK